MRIALPEDAAPLEALMQQSIAAIFPRFYDARQTASAVRYVGEVDLILLADGEGSLKRRSFSHPSTA